MTISDFPFDTIPEAEAASRLAACCGSQRWVLGMRTRRPFRTLSGMLAASEEAFTTLTPADWQEAFAHHPRIGERADAGALSEVEARCATGEQAAAASGPEDERNELARLNRLYDARFGFIFIICASGRSAQDVIRSLRSRLDNSPEVELRVASGEQARITALRLRALVTDDGSTAAAHGLSADSPSLRPSKRT